MEVPAGVDHSNRGEVLQINVNKEMSLRKLLYKYNLTNYIEHFHSILYNYNKISQRTNMLDSLDYTGSRIKKNITMLLKYFFFSIQQTIWKGSKGIGF